MEWCIRTGQDVEVVFHKPYGIKMLIYAKMLLTIESENEEMQRMREIADQAKRSRAPRRRGQL